MAPVLWFVTGEAGLNGVITYPDSRFGRTKGRLKVGWYSRLESPSTSAAARSSSSRYDSERVEAYS